MGNRINFYHLKGAYECRRRRQHQYNVKPTENMQKSLASIQKALLLEALCGTFSGDFQRELHKRTTGIPYTSARQRVIQEKEIASRLERAFQSISTLASGPSGWTIFRGTPEMDAEVALPGGENIIITGIKPDLVARENRGEDTVIRVYSLRTGRPVKEDGTKYSREDAYQDLKIYALYLYGQQLADQILLTGSHAVIEAGYIFLRKPTDKPASLQDAEGHFDENLFVNDKGKPTGNIVVISGEMVSGHMKESDLDTAFKAMLESYMPGKEPEDCTLAQCGNCIYDRICHYQHPPVRTDAGVGKVTPPGSINLNATQTQIQEFLSGYALVNAVPGAGKTLVLALRIVGLMNIGVRPEEIAVITFTNAGAEEFKKRITVYNDVFGSGEPVDGMTACTFNGLGQAILEKEFRKLGFRKPPQVIDTVERNSIIASLLDKYPIEGLDYRNFLMDTKNCKGALSVVADCFAYMKQNRLSESDAALIAERAGRFCRPEAAGRIASLYRRYNALLKKECLVEYADQEMLLLDMLEKDPYYFEQYGLRHILVDECQDTSENQFRILKYMACTSSFESLMVVGDDSQSIYGFRDTTPKFFLQFGKTMALPEGVVQKFYMNDNYRSTPEIIHFANSLIGSNAVRVEKEIIANRSGGKKVTAKGFKDSNDVFQWIAADIARRCKDGCRAEDIAVIAATRTELQKMADVLEECGIPSIQLLPEHYLDNSRVAAAISLSRLFRNPESGEDALVYLNASLGGSLFGLDNEEADEYLVELKAKILEMKEKPEKEAFREYIQMLDCINEDDEIYIAFSKILKKQPDLQSALSYCENFSIFGEKAEMRRSGAYPGIVLTTAHSSKGMEFPVVYNVITKYDDKDVEADPGRIEEQRRLFYVSSTRARDELYVLGKYIAYGGKKEPHFNRFLQEAYNACGLVFDEMSILSEIEAK